MWALSGQNLVEQKAECVDIGRRRDLVAGELLRGGVVGREQRRGPGGVGVGVEQLGDAEVEQDRPRRPVVVLGDEHIGRLQVAVDDQPPVRVGDGVADLSQEPEASVGVEPEAGDVGRDRLAVHQLHREVRLPLVADAAVEETRDVRVAEPGQDLALAAEPVEERRRREPAADHLEGHLLRVGAVGPVGAVDRAHAALAQQAVDLPRADAAPDGLDTARCQQVGRRLGGVGGEESRRVGGVLGGEALADLRVECVVQRPVVAETGLSGVSVSVRLGRQVVQEVQDAPGGSPERRVRGGHGERGGLSVMRIRAAVGDAGRVSRRPSRRVRGRARRGRPASRA